jgi:hypothetical protein
MIIMLSWCCAFQDSSFIQVCCSMPDIHISQHTHKHNSQHTHKHPYTTPSTPAGVGGVSGLMSVPFSLVRAPWTLWWVKLAWQGSVTCTQTAAAVAAAVH